MLWKNIMEASMNNPAAQKQEPQQSLASLGPQVLIQFKLIAVGCCSQPGEEQEPFQHSGSEDLILQQQRR